MTAFYGELPADTTHMSTTDDARLLLRPAEAARMLDISVRQLDRLIEQEVLAAVR